MTPWPVRKPAGGGGCGGKNRKKASNSSEEAEQIDGGESGWLQMLFQEGNDAWCFQSLSVCECVRVSGFCDNTGSGFHAGIHIRGREGEGWEEIENVEENKNRKTDVKEIKDAVRLYQVMEMAAEVRSEGSGMYGYRSRGSFTYRSSSDVQPGPQVLPHCAPGEVLGHGPLTHWQTSCLDTLSSILDSTRGEQTGRNALHGEHRWDAPSISLSPSADRCSYPLEIDFFRQNAI